MQTLELKYQFSFADVDAIGRFLRLLNKMAMPHPDAVAQFGGGRAVMGQYLDVHTTLLESVQIDAEGNTPPVPLFPDGALASAYVEGALNETLVSVRIFEMLSQLCEQVATTGSTMASSIIVELTDTLGEFEVTYVE